MMQCMGDTVSAEKRFHVKLSLAQAQTQLQLSLNSSQQGVPYTAAQILIGYS